MFKVKAYCYISGHLSLSIFGGTVTYINDQMLNDQMLLLHDNQTDLKGILHSTVQSTN